MKKIVTAGAITAFSFSLAFGAEQPDRGQASPQAEAKEERGEHKEQEEYGAQAAQKENGHQKYSNLENAQLKGQDGEDIGQFEDIVVDMETGAVSFIIVAGEDDERHPIPITSVEVGETEPELELVINIDRQEFQDGPTVDREEVAQLGQEQQAREIYEHYGEDWEARQQQQMEFAGRPEREDQEEDPEEQEQRDPLQQQQGQQQERQQQQGQQEQQSTQQLEQQLEQAMTEAGVDEQQAQQEAQQLAQKFSQEELDPQQIEQEIEQALTQAGVDQQQAQQEAQQLAPQVQQQMEFGAPGQQRQEPQAQRQQHGQQQEQSAKLGRDLLEASVRDQNQEDIGEISDLIINLEEGSVSFALIEATEAEGQFAVSPRALQEEDEETWTLNITSQELEQAESVSEDQLQQKAEEQRQTQTAQLQQSPEVFRFEEEDDSAIFGAPEREREDEEQPETQIETPERQQEQQPGQREGQQQRQQQPGQR